MILKNGRKKKLVSFFNKGDISKWLHVPIVKTTNIKCPVMLLSTSIFNVMVDITLLVFYIF